MAISSLFKDRLSDQKRLKRENFASWSNLTIADRARQLCAIAPDTVTHVDADIYLTVNQALQQAESLAQSLWQKDFREGDVLAFITPNWHEAVVINLAACLLGLVICPIVPIYRDHEVQLILADSQAKGISRFQLSSDDAKTSVKVAEFTARLDRAWEGYILR